MIPLLMVVHHELSQHMHPRCRFLARRPLMCDGARGQSPASATTLVHRRRHDTLQLWDPERLTEKIERSVSAHIMGDIDGGVATDDNDRQSGMVAAKVVQALELPEIWHMPVEQDHVGLEAGDRSHRGVGIAGRGNVVAQHAQEIAQHCANPRVVIDHENAAVRHFCQAPRTDHSAMPGRSLLPPQ